MAVSAPSVMPTTTTEPSSAAKWRYLATVLREAAVVPLRPLIARQHQRLLRREVFPCRCVPPSLDAHRGLFCGRFEWCRLPVGASGLGMTNGVVALSIPQLFPCGHMRHPVGRLRLKGNRLPGVAGHLLLYKEATRGRTASKLRQPDAAPDGSRYDMLAY